MPNRIQGRFQPAAPLRQWLCLDGSIIQPTHLNVSQVTGKTGLQVGRVALCDVFEIADHSTRGIELPDHIVTGLAQEHHRADARHQTEKQ